MFNNLSERLGSSLRNIRGKGRLTEDNIKDVLREVRMALLEADVALPVVKAFVAQVKERALGTEVSKSLTPGQEFVKIVDEELRTIMGEANEGLDLRAEPPAIILMAGLQGAGKTTSVGKLAKFLKERDNKKVAVVSGDVYRPAAIEQLKTVAGQVGAEFIPSTIDQKPVDIATAAVEHAKLGFFDVLIIDTAGRLAIDAEMMAEIQAVHAAVNPVETLFVVDSMTGQDAANTAKAFDEALPLTGVILTKTDGDARGGAALSIRHITGKPIKFLGVGEKADALEPFHPDRLASRILGMGDMLSLIEDVERNVDQDKAERLAKKVASGKGFDLNDMRDQLEQITKMGSLTDLIGKIPGMGNIPAAAKAQVNDKEIGRQIAIISSMTKQERSKPDVLNGSRKRRIAAGAGVPVADVNRLVKQHTQMKRMMKDMNKGGGMAKMMKQMQQGGGMPGGMGGGRGSKGGGGLGPF